MTTHPHPSIVILSYSGAAQFLRRPEANVTALISLHGKQEYPLEAHVPHRLDLEFDDTESPDPADIIATHQAFVRRRTEAENGRILIPPTPDHVRQIITFARSIQTLDGTLLCHCGGGISRAPAAALICLTVWTGPGQEVYCVHLLKSVRPAAQPHRDLLRMADELLSRSGRLVNAVSHS